MASRLIVIGLDAADPAVVHRLVGEGKLPALEALLARGVSGRVAGVEGFFVGATWPTFLTGLDPAGHGFHRIEQLEPGTYRYCRPLDGTEIPAGTPFWEVAARAGRRCAVIDVPLSRLRPDVDALQIVGWGSVDRVFPLSSVPSAPAVEIADTIGPYPDETLCDGVLRTATELETFTVALERATEQSAALALDVLGRDNWDLLLHVFTEVHCAGHQAWHLHDPAHPAHDPAIRAAVGDPVERVYRSLDRAVGELVAAAGDARILLLSAHGMTAYRGAPFLFGEILRRLGVTTPPADDAPPLALRVARRALTLLPAPLRGTPDATVGRADPGTISQAANVATSQCFPVANGSPVAAIRLNLRGREPNGIVEPGAEAEALCAELARELREVVHEPTGTPAFTRVWRTDDAHAGAHRDALPDLLVEWNDAVHFGTTVHAGGRGAALRLTSPTIGVVEGANAYHRTGDHRPHGLFVCAGPGVAPGERAEPVRLVDFHPTILGLLGVAATAVDGAAVPELAVPLP